MIFHGYLVNYCGLNNSVFIYLMKTRDLCLFQANFPPCMAFLLTFGYDENGQMAELDLQRTHDTIRNIFLPKIRKLGGFFGQELQKQSFFLCFPYISYSKIPQNTQVVLSIFVQVLQLRSLAVLLFRVWVNFRQKSETGVSHFFKSSFQACCELIGSDRLLSFLD